MPFDKGSMTFRICTWRATDQKGLLANLRTKPLPTVRDIPSGCYDGFVTPVHNLDSDLQADKMISGGLLSGAHVTVQRKIPSKLLAARVAQAAALRLKQEGGIRLPKRAMKEIKQNVVAALLPTMPECLADVPFVLAGDTLLVQAVTDSTWDRFALAWVWANKQVPQLMDFYGVAQALGVNARRLDPVSFVKTLEADSVYSSHGADFLTWLWLGVRPKNKAAAAEPYPETIDTAVEGPIHLKSSDESLVIKKTTGKIAELATALQAGKKPVRLRLMMSVGGAEPYTFDLDEQLCVRGLKYPNSRRHSVVQRVAHARGVVSVLNELVKTYLAMRADEDAWAKSLKAIQTKIADL